MSEAASTARPASLSSRRAFWTKQFYLWHWVSSALALAGMLFFAVTGITLNHAGQIGATPQVAEKSAVIPPALAGVLKAGPASGRHPLPTQVVEWAQQTWSVNLAGRTAQWSDLEIHVDLPEPGGDAWLNLDREDGTATYERTTRGFISYLNDLHKGRHTGTAWMVFLDVFSVASIVFCLTGLVLLFVHARRRPMTWPVVAAGLLLPILVLVLFVH